MGDGPEDEAFVAAGLDDVRQSLYRRFMTGGIVHEDDIVTIFQAVFDVSDQYSRVGISAGRVGGIDVPVEVLNIPLIQELNQLCHRDLPL